MPPWLLYLFSIPPTFVGLFCLALGFGILPFTLQVPRPLIIIFGCYFLFFGLVVFYFASQPSIKRAKLDSTSLYQSDYPWSPNGISEDMESPIEKTVLGAIILSGILIPMHIIAGSLVSGNGIGRILLFIVFGLFDLILLAHIQALISFGWQRLHFGKTRVLFNQFPFFVGQTMTVTFEGGSQLESRRLSATLRCIEEKIRYSSKYDTKGQIVCYEVYADESEFTTDGTGRANISFPLPQHVPNTKLKEDLPTYWELVVKSISRRPKYRRVFLIPVYSTTADNHVVAF